MVKREFNFHPLTRSRWNDFEKLFGQRGACGGCWCMSWRLQSSEFRKGKGDKNKRAMQKIVCSGEVPGIIAYFGKEPVGWCSIAPREKFVSLERSRVLARIDDEPVWSISCFFVAKPYRRMGLSSKLIKAAADYAKKKGAGIVEGYPNELSKGVLPDPFVWTGIASAFRKAKFKEVLRRSKTRPIMRYHV